MFNGENSLSANSNSETCVSQRSIDFEPPKVANSMTQSDESGLSLRRPLWGSQLPGTGYGPKGAPGGANTIVDFLKDLSESLEEVYSIASCERSSPAGSSPGSNSNAILHVNETKTPTDVFSVVCEPRSTSEIHELFESCAETITTLLDLVDCLPTRR